MSSDLKEERPPGGDLSVNDEKAPASSNCNNVESQSISEKALLRKLDIRLLPGLTVLYLLSFLDRSNGMYYAAVLDEFQDTDCLISGKCSSGRDGKGYQDER